MISYLKYIAKGQSLTRIMMNHAFSCFTLTGKVVDVGGGRNPDYFDYFKKNNVSFIESVDGSSSGIDFEKDKLPYDDNSINTVICANVLEHIFNHNHLVSEMYRILNKGGCLVGFVPFLINYHPDPKDYFRYTKEALDKIFRKAQFGEIVIVAIGGSQLYVNFNNIMLSLLIFFRIVIWPFCYYLNLFYEMIKPKVKERFPLGYVFYVKKDD